MRQSELRGDRTTQQLCPDSRSPRELEKDARHALGVKPISSWWQLLILFGSGLFAVAVYYFFKDVVVGDIIPPVDYTPALADVPATFSLSPIPPLDCVYYPSCDASSFSDRQLKAVCEYGIHVAQVSQNATCSAIENLNESGEIINKFGVFLSQLSGQVGNVTKLYNDQVFDLFGEDGYIPTMSQTQNKTLARLIAFVFAGVAAASTGYIGLFLFSFYRYNYRRVAKRADEVKKLAWALLVGARNSAGSFVANAGLAEKWWVSRIKTVEQQGELAARFIEVKDVFLAWGQHTLVYQFFIGVVDSISDQVHKDPLGRSKKWPVIFLQRCAATLARYHGVASGRWFVSMAALDDVRAEASLRVFDEINRRDSAHTLALSTAIMPWFLVTLATRADYADHNSTSQQIHSKSYQLDRPLVEAWFKKHNQKAVFFLTADDWRSFFLNDVWVGEAVDALLKNFINLLRHCVSSDGSNKLLENFLFFPPSTSLTRKIVGKIIEKTGWQEQRDSLPSQLVRCMKSAQDKDAYIAVIRDANLDREGRTHFFKALGVSALSAGTIKSLVGDKGEHAAKFLEALPVVTKVAELGLPTKVNSVYRENQSFTPLYCFEVLRYGLEKSQEDTPICRYNRQKLIRLDRLLAGNSQLLLGALQYMAEAKQVDMSVGEDVDILQLLAANLLKAVCLELSGNGENRYYSFTSRAASISDACCYAVKLARKGFAPSDQNGRFNTDAALNRLMIKAHLLHNHQNTRSIQPWVGGAQLNEQSVQSFGFSPEELTVLGLDDAVQTVPRP